MQMPSRGTFMPERSMKLTIQLCGAVWAVAASVALAAEPALLNVTTDEPRAFGYQVGDVVERSVTVHVPSGLKLDEASVPKPGARGKALELRGVQRSEGAEAGGRFVEWRLEYQVFLSPPQVRTLEMPSFTLRFEGRPRNQELRVEAWPVTVAPLAPGDVSPRRGLGELLPDELPPLIDLRASHVRFTAYACVLLLLLGYLAHVYLGVPWWSRGRRPFAQAWRTLGHAPLAGTEAQRREAFRRLHEAFNQTAGETLFEHGIERFVSAQPRFAPLHTDLVEFFRLSRREFFADSAAPDADPRWLIDFCRRCRDAERGSA
jgi:mxaA protein